MNVEAELAITRLMYKAACDLDDRNLDAMAECFAEDASVVIDIQSSGVSEPMQGRDALMTLVRARVAEQTDRRRHVISNVIIDTESDERARVRSFLTLVSIADGRASVLTTGCYHDLVVHRDGCWVIASRRIELDLPY